VRVLFNYATISGTAQVEICGEDDALMVSEIGGKTTLDVFLPAKAREVSVFDRGNYQSNVSFTVTKLWPTAADALTYQRTHAADIARAGVLHVENDIGAPSGAQWHYFRGGFQSVGVKCFGAATVATYSFIGGLPSATVINPQPY